MMTFSGFTSRWTASRLWRAHSPRQICRTIRRVSSGENRESFSRKPRVSPSIYSSRTRLSSGPSATSRVWGRLGQV